jgi:dolichyl-diphosphooligosaccharide--protein glycosyltransferase
MGARSAAGVTSRLRRLGPSLPALAVLAILAVAAVLRVWVPWDHVFGGARTNFLETDAWYHVRLVENQVRNFPHAVHFDPYVAPSGRVVAVAPLFDALIAGAVFFTRGAQAPAEYIERVAALAPSLIGLAAVLGVIVLGTLLFDRRAGLVAGAVAAVSPGHFLERTLIGYVDHHALEVLLAFATMIALVRCLARPDDRRLPVAGGVLLGLYLLTWGSGAYLVAILTLWIFLASFVGDAARAAAAGRAVVTTAAIALVLVVALQDHGLPRFDTQVASLLALLVASALVVGLAGRPRLKLAVFAGATAAAAVGLLTLWPGLLSRAAVDLARFRPDPMRMAVIETRPLFLYAGTWAWLQPWTLFRSTFVLGLAGLIWLVVDLRRTRRLDHLLLAVFTGVTYVATIGQNRFGYYLVPAAAVVIGGLGVRLARRIERKPAAVAVFVLFVLVAIVPGVEPAFAAAKRRHGMPDAWADAMAWLRTRTPEPFASDDHYFARYEQQQPPARDTVMNWWDQGYWLVQAAHRVPVSDPTQDGAGTAAAFYAATDEASAAAILKATRARYVLADAELPFRPSSPGALGGKFQGLLDWASLPSSRFYALCFARLDAGGPLQPVWIFREAYYQSMAYRLATLGGRAAAPAESAWLVELRDKRDDDGHPFCEIANAQAYPSADEAKAVAARRGAGFEVVGLNPSRHVFPAAAVDGLREVDEVRRDGQLVRVFEVTP